MMTKKAREERYGAEDWADRAARRIARDVEQIEWQAGDTVSPATIATWAQVIRIEDVEDMNAARVFHKTPAKKRSPRKPRKGGKAVG
jgi:hypothetical protein